MPHNLICPDAVQSWCYANGLQVLKNNGMKCASITLQPYLICKKVFEKALKLQPHYHNLLQESMKHPEFTELIRCTGEADEFTKKLLDCMKLEVMELVVLRSDYMITEQDNLRQVELNTMSVSLWGLSPKVRRLHKVLNKTVNIVDDNQVSLCELFVKGVEVWKAKHIKDDVHGEPCVLMIVQENEGNVFDQSAVVCELMERGVNVRRIPFDQLLSRATFDKDGIMCLDGTELVAIVYWRTAYRPEDYPSENHWLLRRKIEAASLILCPSIKTQLAGMKKMQEWWYFSSQKNGSDKLAQALSNVCDCFGKFFKDYHKKDINVAFVLKPQREGGGNNLYDNDIPERWHPRYYVAQELFYPQTFSTKILLDNGKLTVGAVEEAVCEIGIYSGYLADSDGSCLANIPYAGYLARTKAKSAREGGFVVGISALDSLALSQ